MIRSRYHFRVLVLTILVMATQSAAIGQSDPQGTPSADGPIFGVAPAGEPDLSPFRLQVGPGESLATTLVVTNDGAEPVELRSYAVDIVTAVNGGYLVVPEDAGTVGEAAWLSVQPEPYSLNPGDQFELTISITVPAGAAPGEYVAAIATATTVSTALPGSDSFRQTIRKVNTVTITVPGPIETGFAIGTPQFSTSEDGTTVTVPIANTGNTRVKPTGSITITAASDEVVAEIPVAMGSVYAWDSTTIQGLIVPALPAGEYRVSASLSDLATGATAALAETPATVADGA